MRTSFEPPASLDCALVLFQRKTGLPVGVIRTAGSPSAELRLGGVCVTQQEEFGSF